MPAGTAFGIALRERAQDFHRFRAAAQLDQNCYAIFGTRTVLAESPEFVDGAKRALIFSGGQANATLSSRKYS